MRLACQLGDPTSAGDHTKDGRLVDAHAERMTPPQLASSLLSISNAVRPEVAGCLGNESMSGEEAH